MKFSKYRFITSFFAIAIALLLDLKLAPIIGWSPSLYLTILITLASFVSLWELIFFALLGMWIFNSGPALGLGTIAIGILPLATFWSKKLLPWTPSLNNIVFVALAVTIFYFALDYSFIIKIPQIFFEDILISEIFGIVAFQSFGYVFKEK